MMRRSASKFINWLLGLKNSSPSMGKLFPGLKRLQDHPADTAKNFRMAGHVGTVSFITSMTEHFCAGCNRLPLLADGNFKVCLFDPSEVSLGDPLRRGAEERELKEIIGAAIKKKKSFTCWDV